MSNGGPPPSCFGGWNPPPPPPPPPVLSSHYGQFQNSFWLPPRPGPPPLPFQPVRHLSWSNSKGQVGNNGVFEAARNPRPPWLANGYYPQYYPGHQLGQHQLPHTLDHRNVGGKMQVQWRQEHLFVQPPLLQGPGPSQNYQNTFGTTIPNRESLDAGLRNNNKYVNGFVANSVRNYHSETVTKSREGSLTALDTAGSESDDGGVLIYIDNSNIWINTMAFSVKQFGFRSDIKQDLRTRVNIIKLLTMAAAERPIIRAVLYGSEPPPVSKFWNNIKEIKFCKVDVQVTRRSTYSNREREVDQSIMLDIGVDLVIHQNHARHGGTIILFTGDGGMVTAVRRALEYGWNVELWGYRSSVAKIYLEEVEKNKKFQIKYLDDHFQEFVFYKLEWNIRIPQERSCVLTFRKISAEEKSEVLELFVKAFTQLVRMPMAGRYFKVNGDDAEQKLNQTHLVIVCSVGKLILKEDSRSDFHLKHSKIADVTTHPQNGVHGSNNSKKVNSSFHFTPEQWETAPGVLNLPFLAGDSDFNGRVKAEFESMVEECLRNAVETVDNPKYDFNTEVYRRIEEIISLNSEIFWSQYPTPHSASVSTNQYALLATSDSTTRNSANYPVLSSTRNSDNLSPNDQLNQLVKKYKPILRSLPQFLQELKLNDDIDIEPTTLEAKGTDDDGEGNYTVQTLKKHKRKFQKYSQECKYSFRCVNGFKCTFNHTDKEKEFFKLQTNSSLRKTYKFKPCDHHEKDRCKYKKATSYMCPFSHGHFCMTCKLDEDGGHDAATCLAALPPRSQSVPEAN